ncbi:hypothetical protein [Microbacterium sp.]|uniref:hypothetical protein n=1 Tax=Microbacterium sp. TaxID=51671 RepID=UPI0039E6E8AE
MVAHILRLRLDLLLGALRGDRRRVVRTVLGFVVLVAAVAIVCVGVLRLRGAALDVAFTVTTVACAALTLGFFVTAIVGGVADQLDPRRFAVFGASTRATAWSVLLASVVSVPVLGLLAVGVCLVVLWRAHGVSLGVTLLSVVLGVLTCLLLAKVALALGSLALRDRRSRELTGVFLVAVVVVVVPVAIFFVSLEWGGAVPSALAQAVEVLAVTPFGAAWALPGAALRGTMIGPLVVAVLTVGGLTVLWRWLVERLLTTTERPGTARERRGLGWFDITGGTPAGGIAARSLVYWLRDPRYLVNVAIIPVAAVIVVVPLLFVGVHVGTAALIPAPLMALFLGWIAHNDLAYDSNALWMHLASAVRGTADRAGRLVPVVAIGTLLLAITIPVTVSLHGRWAIMPAMIGACAALFLCGLGLSSIMSVAAPYPVSRPGESPFQQPQRTGGGLAQAVVLIGAVALSAPALWWAWLSLADETQWAWAAMWGGLGIGVVVLAVGVVIGGAVFDRSGGRLMEFAEST